MSCFFDTLVGEWGLWCCGIFQFGAEGPRFSGKFAGGPRFSGKFGYHFFYSNGHNFLPGTSILVVEVSKPIYYFRETQKTWPGPLGTAQGPSKWISNLAPKILIFYAETAHFLDTIAFWVAKAAGNHESCKRASTRVLKISEARADIVVAPPKQKSYPPLKM